MAKSHKAAYEVRKTDKPRSWGIFISGTEFCIGTAFSEETASLYVDRLNNPLVTTEEQIKEDK